MSGIKKGSAPKKPAGASAAGAKKPAGATQAKKSGGGGGGSAGAKKGGGGGGGAGGPVMECFAGCGVKGAPDTMIQHYEKCFSTNEIKHIQALSDKLDPHFGDPTHCQICNAEFPHSGLLLQHIFAVATGKKKAPGPPGAAAAAHAAEVHGTLFSSFVQELITMPMVGQEEATEYLLSLVVPDYDPTGGEDDHEDDEENDLYEDDEGDEDEEDEDVDMDELVAFEQFMAMQGIDLGAMAASQGGKGGPGGKKGKIAFLKEMMRQMGGDDDEEEEEEEEEDDERPARGAKAAPKGAKGAKNAKGAGAAAASASAAPAGSNAPGDLKCGSCDQLRGKDLYSSAQLKKKGQRRCKFCVEGGGGGAAASAASSSAEPSPHKPTAAAAGKGSAAAAAASSAASAKPAAAASASSSAAASSPKSKQSTAHNLHRHHAATHHYANGDAIESEPEETGDGEAPQAMEESSADEDEDDEEEDDEDEDEEDEDDEDDDPFAAMFGGGRRSGGGRAAAKARSKAAAAKMGLRVVVERPGQALTRDRRLRLKPSIAHPVRCWQPHDGDVKCSVCAWRLPSRLIRGWELVCLRCALQHDWIPDEEAPSDEDEEHSERARAKKLSMAPRVAHHASMFPNYRAGITHCVRPACKSERLLTVYDEKGDEYVICAACKGTKQKLRYFDSMAHKLVESLQEPTTHD